MKLSRAAAILNQLLKPLDIAVVRRSQLVEMFPPFGKQSMRRFHKGRLPSDARAYLCSDNPHLVKYKKQYAGHPAAHHSRWQPDRVEAELNLASFREDNLYIWQSRDVKSDPVVAYALSADYVKAIDSLGLLHKFDEDGAFGALTITLDDGKTVSRDLLDSVLEINFLERHLNLSWWSSLRVLDIGAGYGRLAHRLVQGLPNLDQVLCVDAVPESSFLCEYYLRYRGVSNKAQAIPLHLIEDRIQKNSIDIVTNIHSFQECKLESIFWWLEVIARSNAEFFMLAHYRNELLSCELDRKKINFRPLLERYGFELIAQEPIYASDTLADSYGLYPKRWYYLFRSSRRKNRSTSLGNYAGLEEYRLRRSHDPGATLVGVH
jgi:SAM-dependent methyltransferase